MATNTTGGQHALEASAYAAAAAHLRGSWRDASVVLHDSYDGTTGAGAVEAIFDVCRGELTKVAQDSACEPSTLMAMLVSASESLGDGGDTSEVARTLQVLSAELGGDRTGWELLCADMARNGDAGPFIASGIATLANILALRAELEGVDAAGLASAECLALTGTVK